MINKLLNLTITSLYMGGKMKKNDSAEIFAYLLA